MVLIVEPCFVPSPKRGFHGKFKKTATRVGLKYHTPNNLLVSGTQLLFQEEIILEQRKIRRDS
jgi:hypothetical protein